MSYIKRFSFEGPIEGYVHNFLAHNFWKIKNIMDYEDALQEARFLFCILLKRLEKSKSFVENDAHLMSLFKTAWGRYFITLSNKNTKYKETPFTNLISEESDNSDWVLNEAELAGFDINSGYFECLLSKVSGEVREVLCLLINVPQHLLKEAEEAYRGKNMNAFLCKALGKPSGIDLVGKVKQYFLSD
jgi:hypothetical protein